MADSSDVANALVAAIEAVRQQKSWRLWVIYRGYPEADALDKALADDDNMIHITVNERPGFTRLTTRFPDEAVPVTPVPPSLTVTMAGITATFAGTCSVDQIAGVQAGNVAWAYRCAAGDTPGTVAAALAHMSGGTASGATVTLPGLLAARTARDAGTLRPTRTQEKGYTVCVWCADPDTRDAVCSAIDAALSDVKYLTLVDGSFGRLTWMDSQPFDRAENANLYRRELYYRVEYSTTIAATATPVLFSGVVLNGGNGAPGIAGALPPRGLTDAGGVVLTGADGQQLTGAFI